MTATDATGEDAPFRFRLAITGPGEAASQAAAVNRRLAGFLAGGPAAGEDAHALQVAVEELLTNLGKFGLPAAPGAAVQVEGSIAVQADGATLTIVDDGPAFDPTGAPAPDLSPRALLERPPGGLGLCMLRQLFGQVAYRREDGRNKAVWRRRTPHA